MQFRQLVVKSGRRWFPQLALTILVCALALSVIPAQASELNPAAPFSKIGDGSNVQMVVDSNGVVHAVWVGNQYHLIEFTQTQYPGIPSVTSTMPFQVANYRGQFTKPFLTLAGTTLELAFIEQGGVCYISRSLTAISWSQPNCSNIAYPGASGIIEDLQLATTGDGQTFLAFQDQYKFFVSRYKEGAGWSLLPDPSEPTTKGHQPKLATDKANNLTIVWQQDRPALPAGGVASEILGRVWQNNSWGKTYSVSGLDQKATQWYVTAPQLAISSDGTLHIAYTLYNPNDNFLGNPGLMYRQGTLDNLQAPEKVSGFGIASAIAVQGSRVELVGSQLFEKVIDKLYVGDLEIVWSRREANGWSPALDISHSGRAASGPTLGIVSGGESVVLWDNSTSRGESGVLLERSQQNGQHWPAPLSPDLSALASYVGRADIPVSQGQAARSWLWGPRNWQSQLEPYTETIEAQRSVFYYDKARVEVGDPNLALTDPAYFTNGLLVTEMASGRIQLDNAVLSDTRQPASIPVAGDPGNTLAPTYAAFHSLVYIPEIGQDSVAKDQTGQKINQNINQAGAVTTGNVPFQVNYTHFVQETQHNIAAPFWDFLNQHGPVYQNGQFSNDLVFNWVTTMGYPITEPYWTKATVAGVERDVMVQLFQRRILTYTPANPASFQVEMGNVGQHYYLWRYGSAPWLRPQ